MPPTNSKRIVVPPPRLAKWSRVETTRVGEYRVFDVDRHAVRDPNGTPRRDVFTFRCPDWCNVVALTEQDELVLVWQYRFGSDTLSLEIPGGMINPGETPLEAARRELREETGYVVRSIEPLLVVHPNPALQDNRCHTFLARGAHLEGAPKFDDNEECEVALVQARDADELVSGGHVTHALVVCALEAFLRRRLAGRV